jgi:nitroreductase
METWDAIRARRHVRQYASQPIAPADLDRILEAGRLAPSVGNAQARDFIVVTDRGQLRKLAEVCGGAEHLRDSAATVAFVVPEGDDKMIARYSYDAGQATIPMAITAVDLGIGSAPAEVGDQQEIREILGVPSDRRCLHILAFGYPVDGPLTPPAKLHRRPFDDVVHRGHW